MNATDIAALVGAAAWALPIFYGAYKFYAKPKLSIYAGGSAQIGFTELGPIFNPRAAFRATRSDIVVVRISVTVQFPNGIKSTFRCVNLEEILSQTSKVGDSGQIVYLDNPFLALLVTPNALVERMLKCQSQEFRESSKRLEAQFESYLENQRHLLGDGNDINYHAASKTSAERRDIESLYQNWFQWEAGLYNVEIHCDTSRPAKVEFAAFQFILSERYAIDLRRNLAAVSRYWDLRSIRHVTPGQAIPMDQPQWVWREIDMKEIS
jgi:hypothetical protein